MKPFFETLDELDEILQEANQLDVITTEQFSGWAIVEMMGHQKEIGFVTYPVLGGMWRIDVPELPEESETQILGRQRYEEDKVIPRGATVKQGGLPARSRLVGTASLYAVNPCTKEFALQAYIKSVSRPLIVVALPKQSLLPVTTLPGETVLEAAQRTMDDDYDDGEDRERGA